MESESEKFGRLQSMTAQELEDLLLGMSEADFRGPYGAAAAEAEAAARKAEQTPAQRRLVRSENRRMARAARR